MIGVAFLTGLLLAVIATHPWSPAYLGFLFSAKERAAAFRAPGHGLSGFLARTMMHRFGNDAGAVHVVRTQLDVRAGQTVVELGPGSGHGLRPILDALGSKGQAVALEISPAFRGELSKAFGEDVRSGRLEIHGEDAALHMEQKMSDESVDRIVGANVVYFLDPLDEYLQQFYRVLRPGGILVLAVKNVAKKGNDPSIFVNVDWDDCIRAMQRAGFEATERSPQLDGVAQYVPLVGIKRRQQD